MKNNNTTKIKTSITMIVLLMIMLVLSIGLTITYFSNEKAGGGTVSFSKVEIGASSNLGGTIEIQNAVAGTNVVNSNISFVKDANSVPIFVRAKISWSVPSNITGINKDIISPYIKDIRTGSDYGLLPTANSAFWTTGTKNNSNYIYLVSETVNNTPFVVNDTTEYVLSNGITLPMSLERLANNAQYGIKINLNIAFQAIQTNIDDTSFANIESIFNSTFAEPANENYGETLNAVYTIGNNSANGSITLVNGQNVLAKSYTVGDTVTMTAIETASDIFVAWKDADGNIISTDAVYTTIAEIGYNNYFYAEFETIG